MLSQTPTDMKLLVPAASVGQNASGGSGGGAVARTAEKRGAAVGRAATTTRDGHRSALHYACAFDVWSHNGAEHHRAARPFCRPCEVDLPSKNDHG